MLLCVKMTKLMRLDLIPRLGKAVSVRPPDTASVETIWNSDEAKKRVRRPQALVPQSALRGFPISGYIYIVL